MKRTPLNRKTGLNPGGPIRKKRAKGVSAILKEEVERKLTRTQLIKLCDSAWGRLVKLMAGGKCEWCPKDGLDPHHMVLQRHMATRFLPENGVFLCKGCHMHFHDKESDTGWEWMRKNRPESYNKVRLLKVVIVRHRPAELRVILEGLRERLREFGE